MSDEIGPLTLAITLDTANLLIDAIEIAIDQTRGSDFCARCVNQLSEMKKVRDLVTEAK